MKKTLTLLSLMLVFVLLFGLFAACANNNEDKLAYQQYSYYVAFAEEQGLEPMSYEQWLATVKGEKGDKGDDGKDGVDGKDGKDGADGTDGIDGIDGRDGVSIVDVKVTVTVDSDGKQTFKFVFKLSNGQEIVRIVTQEPAPAPSPDVDVTVSEPELANILGSGKLYLTTLGQSTGYNTMSSILTQLVGFSSDEFVKNNVLNANEVPDGSTVIIVIGASAKGLGSEGLTVESELARAKQFIAKKDKINIIGVYIGGASNRGSDSDLLINEIFGKAKVTLYTTAGNTDNKLTEYSGETSNYAFSSNTAMVDSLKYLLGK